MSECGEMARLLRCIRSRGIVLLLLSLVHAFSHALDRLAAVVLDTIDMALSSLLCYLTMYGTAWRNGFLFFIATWHFNGYSFWHGWESHSAGGICI